MWWWCGSCLGSSFHAELSDHTPAPIHKAGANLLTSFSSSCSACFRPSSTKALVCSLKVFFRDYMLLAIFTVANPNKKKLFFSSGIFRYVIHNLCSSNTHSVNRHKYSEIIKIVWLRLYFFLCVC